MSRMQTRVSTLLPAATSRAIRGISSMATRQLLAELTQMYTRLTEHAVAIESVGGIEVSKRLQAGEAFDVVILASEAVDQLIASGHVQPGSRVDLVHSGVAIAVCAGHARPDMRSEGAVRQSVLAAHSVGYSTGPSGVALVKLFERWGILDSVKDRMVQAPPGVPVGTLVARGEVALGFQQLCELIHVDGIDIAGPLPASIQINTTFSGGVCTACTQADAVRALLTYMASDTALASKLRQGMQPA